MTLFSLHCNVRGGSRLESSEAADRACACFGAAVSAWLCVQDTQECV